MQHQHLSVREIQASDIPFIVDYWLHSEPSYLTAMGVDLNKIPAADQLEANLLAQINKPIHEKNAYCIIWQLDGKPIGHSNTNPTVFGEEAYMHLHIWRNDSRKKGMGLPLLQMTLPYFFDNLQLKKLYCQPYALNPAPNRTMEKAGFRFIREYVTIPGSLNFEQPVNLWEITAEQYAALYSPGLK